MKEARFLVKTSFYVWADDEAGAKKQAQTHVEKMRAKYDNRCAVDAINWHPFGKIGTGDSVDISDIETMEIN